eukprot:365252-Chlamydomonas_euryale.AAC.12
MQACRLPHAAGSRANQSPFIRTSAVAPGGAPRRPPAPSAPPHVRPLLGCTHPPGSPTWSRCLAGWRPVRADSTCRYLLRSDGSSAPEG